MSLFAQRLRKLRDELDLTQEQLGIELAKLVPEREEDFGQAAISSLEKDKTKPRYHTLLALCDLLNCSLDYLVGRSAYRSGPQASLSGMVVLDQVLYEIVRDGGTLPEHVTWFGVVPPPERLRILTEAEYGELEAKLPEDLRRKKKPG